MKSWWSERCCHSDTRLSTLSSCCRCAQSWYSEGIVLLWEGVRGDLISEGAGGALGKEWLHLALTRSTHHNSKIEEVGIIEPPVRVTIWYYLADILADEGAFREAFRGPHSPTLAWRGVVKGLQPWITLSSGSVSAHNNAPRLPQQWLWSYPNKHHNNANDNDSPAITWPPLTLPALTWPPLTLPALTVCSE